MGKTGCITLRKSIESSRRPKLEWGNAVTVLQ